VIAHTESVDLVHLLSRYRAVRRQTEVLCEPLCAEDQVIQSMPDASPARWHRAHTTWFFETFILKKFRPNYRPLNPAFEVLFNSYYNSVGEQFPRHRRGLLSRPTVAEVGHYRRAVDEQMSELIEQKGDDPELQSLLEVGLNHEQQHQELILTDIKHMLSCNPLFPVYREREHNAAYREPATQRWVSCEGGITEIGAGPDGFRFDNELPRHRLLLEPFQLSSRLVTNSEYLEFMQDGGYERPEFWLSLGWSVCKQEGWKAPLYWQSEEDGWSQFTLSGLRPVDLHEPVCHVSFFEADAFARWAGFRLPLEGEWETGVASLVGDCPRTRSGNFVETEAFHPQPASREQQSHLLQAYGDVWEWTASPYVAYPGYVTPPGAIGEYNGKFMCNQYVLRGGSCATPGSHIRGTYRNFFPPEARWQFSGIRLAK